MIAGFPKDEAGELEPATSAVESEENEEIPSISLKM
jgi:hypothetical protein